VKYLASSRLLIALIESPSSCSGAQAGRKFVTYHRFFSFVRRIWHTPRGGIYDVVRDVSAKRLACQMIYSRFYETAQNSTSHLSSVYTKVSSLLSFVSYHVKLVIDARRNSFRSLVDPAFYYFSYLNRPVIVLL